MLSWITYDEDEITITVEEGNSTEAVLRNILDKLSAETLENLSVTKEEESESERPNGRYLTAVYRLSAITPSTASILDPDAVT